MSLNDMIIISIVGMLIIYYYNRRRTKPYEEGKDIKETTKQNEVKQK